VPAMSKQRDAEFSHPFTFGRQVLIVCSTAEFSRQHFHKS
jgi:hypothetical protein